MKDDEFNNELSCQFTSEFDPKTKNALVSDFPKENFQPVDIQPLVEDQP